MELNINQMKNVPCKKCGCIYWMNTFKMKYIPSVVSRSGKPEIKPRPIAVCASCGSFWEDTADMDHPVAEKSKQSVFPAKKKIKENKNG